jgi:hypothetical protein
LKYFGHNLVTVDLLVSIQEVMAVFNDGGDNFFYRVQIMSGKYISTDQVTRHISSPSKTFGNIDNSPCMTIWAILDSNQ